MNILVKYLKNMILKMVLFLAGEQMQHCHIRAMPILEIWMMNLFLKIMEIKYIYTKKNTAIVIILPGY